MIRAVKEETAQFQQALKAMGRLRALLEPQGGVIAWQRRPREEVRAFLRMASSVQWNLGIACEDIIMSVGIKLPHGIEV